ncbi:hypothetical protein P7K49_013221 [Saguinus oedipus]|uniref:PH domain-containing protein n=1 Tax=Saguinus oedipus TaxID=9490 RepID=A0ABQ9VF98_SAGOE|nr:hypothetical protein P7K49_013221 [Saguinus oedipus]
MAGRSSGSSLPTSVCSSTKLIRYQAGFQWSRMQVTGGYSPCSAVSLLYLGSVLPCFAHTPHAVGTGKLAPLASVRATVAQAAEEWVLPAAARPLEPTSPCCFQDDYPLASLPLLGYSLSVPREADGIHKDYVFKLQFKSHVYFFRAESKYTFERWMEVIEGASSSTGSIVQGSPRTSSGMEGTVREKKE